MTDRVTVVEPHRCGRVFVPVPVGWFVLLVLLALIGALFIGIESAAFVL